MGGPLLTAASLGVKATGKACRPPRGPALRGPREGDPVLSSQLFASRRVGIGLDQIGEEIPPDIERTRTAPLIETIGAFAIRIGPDSGHAIGGNPHRIQKNSVG